MKTLCSIAAVLALCVTCFSQGKQPTESREKAVQWVSVKVPVFSPLAFQARVFADVQIEIHFRGCELDPASPHIINSTAKSELGVKLEEEALASVKSSVIRCGDFENATTTQYYEFGEYVGKTCAAEAQRLEVQGNRVRILRSEPCVDTSQKFQR